ncbi:hypothetical protein [Streptomyces sp. NBC_00076]|uniref:hypothetical protein n=1 Tax=Streptomyces sp. NBC_00076 TaxID=2975642 RepID=UPI00324FB576
MSHRIAPRRVAFDFSRGPLHRIPGGPNAPHVINSALQTQVKHLAVHDTAVQKIVLPSWRELGAAAARHLWWSYHPSRQGPLGRTVAYPGQSPAARAGT